MNVSVELSREEWEQVVCDLGYNLNRIAPKIQKQIDEVKRKEEDQELSFSSFCSRFDYRVGKDRGDDFKTMEYADCPEQQRFMAVEYARFLCGKLGAEFGIKYDVSTGTITSIPIADEERSDRFYNLLGPDNIDILDDLFNGSTV